jgi:hypothetical protein
MEGRDFASAAAIRKQPEVYASIIGLAGKNFNF